MTKTYKKLLLVFVGLSAILFSPISTTIAGAAPAPCRAIGGHKYKCGFWTKAPVEGHSNGTIAKGKNWIVCQAKGRTVSVGGWKNNWWAWTVRDRGTGTYGNGWGWVNAVYAKGGDSFEGFAGVPKCYGPPLPPQPASSIGGWRR